MKSSKNTSGSRAEQVEERYREFAAQYVANDSSVIETYLKCSFADKSLSRDKQRRAAYNLSGHWKVQKYIKEERKALRRRMQKKEATRVTVNLSQEDALNEQAIIAFSDISNYIDEDRDENKRVVGYKLRPMEKIPFDARRAIKSMSCTTSEANGVKTTRWRIELWDKGKALDAIFKHLGLYNEKVSVNYNYGTLKVPATVTREQWAELITQQKMAIANLNSPLLEQ